MKVALGDICTIKSKLVDPQAEGLRDLPHVAPDSIERDTGKLLDVRTAATDGVTSSKYHFPPGSVLYSKIRPNLNKATRVDFAGLCSADMYPLAADEEHIDPDFLCRLLRSPQFLRYATTFSNRANIPKINREQLFGFEFTLPSLETQVQSVRTLELAEQSCEYRQQIRAKLSVLERSIFSSMFPSGTESDSTLADIAQISSGVTKGRRTGAATTDVPYLAVANVQAGHLQLDNVKLIAATAVEIERYRLLHGDIVLTEGGDPDKLGRGTIWRSEIPTCIHQNHIFRVRIHDNSIMLPEYLSAYLASLPARRYFLRAAKQTTGIASINTTQLRNTPIVVPPIDSQVEFRNRIAAVENLRQQVVEAARESRELLLSIQRRTFEGCA